MAAPPPPPPRPAAIAPPLLVLPSIDTVPKTFAGQVRRSKTRFALRLLRASRDAGVINLNRETGGGNGGNGGNRGNSANGANGANTADRANTANTTTKTTPTTPTTDNDDEDDDDDDDVVIPPGSFFLQMASAFQDAALLTHLTLDPTRGQVLTPNRHLMLSDARLFALGLGPYFTSVEMLLHTPAGRDDAEEDRARIYGARAEGTVMFVVFVDPERLLDDDDQDGDANGDGDDEDDDDGDKTYNDTGPHAFELVSGGQGGYAVTKVQLRDGIVLISRAGGVTWTVKPVVGASQKLVEMRFLISRELVRILCSLDTNDGVDDDGALTRPPLQTFCESVAAEGPLEDGREAIELFFSGVAAAPEGP